MDEELVGPAECERKNEGEDGAYDDGIFREPFEHSVARVIEKHGTWQLEVALHKKGYGNVGHRVSPRWPARISH